MKSLQLELLCSTHQPHAVRRGRACSRWFRSPASANWPHTGNKKKSARFRRGEPNVPTALIGRLNDDDSQRETRQEGHGPAVTSERRNLKEREERVFSL